MGRGAKLGHGEGVGACAIALSNVPRAAGEATSILHAERARGFAENGDVGWIAAERGDVVAHPAQRRDLVEQAVVAGDSCRGFLAEFGMGEIAEHAEPVVYRNQDDAAPGEGAPIVRA